MKVAHIPYIGCSFPPISKTNWDKNGLDEALSRIGSIPEGKQNFLTCSNSEGMIAKGDPGKSKRGSGSVLSLGTPRIKKCSNILSGLDEFGCRGSRTKVCLLFWMVLASLCSEKRRSPYCE